MILLPLVYSVLTHCLLLFQNPNNFANPVYETMYNGGEEKKNLLSAVVEEPLPLDNDSV